MDDGGKNEAASIAIFGQARQARVSSESSKPTKRRALILMFLSEPELGHGMAVHRATSQQHFLSK